jgi:hypothetical protein
MSALRDRVIDAVLAYEAKTRIRANLVVVSQDLFHEIMGARDKDTPLTKVTIFDLPVGFDDTTTGEVKVYRALKRSRKT